MTSPATTLPSITRDEFGAFFAALDAALNSAAPNDVPKEKREHYPFSWQEEVLDHICKHGVWPERINAPTGSVSPPWLISTFSRMRSQRLGPRRAFPAPLRDRGTPRAGRQPGRPRPRDSPPHE